jgi:hypothetical protein
VERCKEDAVAHGKEAGCLLFGLKVGEDELGMQRISLLPEGIGDGGSAAGDE